MPDIAQELTRAAGGEKKLEAVVFDALFHAYEMAVRPLLPQGTFLAT